MKAAVILLLLLATSPLTSHGAVGIQPYCLVNAKDKTVACNYESAQACLGYIEEGDHCITNLDYIGDLPPSVKSNSYSSSPEVMDHLAAMWQGRQKYPWVQSLQSKILDWLPRFSRLLLMSL